MEISTYTDVRKNFAKVIDEICDNHTPLIVTRQKGKPAVLISLEDYNSIEETLFNLTNPINCERLFRSIKNAEEGNLIKHELVNV